MYLFRLISINNSVLGAWISLPSLLDSFQKMMPEQTVVCMLDEEHQLLQSSLFPDY